MKKRTTKEKKTRREKTDGYIMLVAGIILFVMLICSIFLFCGDKSEYVTSSYTVCEGDTLDALYYEYGGGDYYRWRYEMQQINDMQGCCLYSGEEIIVLEVVE